MVMQKLYSYKSKQQGVVLIVSLVFLIALTGVAAALMQNTTTDMKMSGASEERSEALQETISAIDEVIYDQVESGVNLFAQPIAKFTNEEGVEGIFLEKLDTTAADAAIFVSNNEYGKEADCPHSKSASSAQVFTCNILRVQVNRNYGRKNTSEVVVHSGIAQQLLR